MRIKLATCNQIAHKALAGDRPQNRGLQRPEAKPQVFVTTWVDAKARRWEPHKKQFSDLRPFYELIAGFT